MEFAVAKPSAALSHVFSLYYYIKFDYPLIADIERADVGYMRFMFQGDGTYEYADGGTSLAHPVTLVGPSTVHANYFMNGPLDTFGAVLLPEFWSAIAGLDASEHMNKASDGLILLGDDYEAVRVALAACASVEEMARVADNFFLPRLKETDADQLKVVQAIGDWLRNDPIPSPDILYEKVDVGPRQVMRIANRFYGAPPNLLARKYRALRTASLFIAGQKSVTDDMASRYSDRSHLSREVKHFTGLSPRELSVQKSPIMQVTLSPDLFNYDAPWT